MILLFNPMDLVTPDLGLVFWTTIAFGLFWFLVGKYAFKPIANAINSRNKSIDDALNAAENAKLEMAKLQNENEKILREAREESANILKEARSIKDGIINDAHNKAKDEAQKIIDQAKSEITAQKNAALAEVKNEVSKLSLDIAQKVIGRELDSNKEHQSFINNLVEKEKLN